MNVRRKNFAQTATQGIIADGCMSFDSALAVAGAAQEHPTMLYEGSHEILPYLKACLN